MEQMMTQVDQISARLTVLETVVRQLITHMAVRDEDPQRWVQTRKTLAMSAIAAEGAGRAALLQDATARFFDEAEQVAADYDRPGTPRPLVR
jgi:hypothetical protein